MDKAAMKKYILLITYAVLLYLGIAHLDLVLQFLQKWLGILQPVIIGICLAFVLNLFVKLYEEHLLKFLWKNKYLNKYKRLLCIILTLVSILAIFYLLIYFIVPQLVSSIQVLVNSMSGYISNIQQYVTELPEELAFIKNIWDTASMNLNEFVNNFGNILTNALKGMLDFTVNFAGRMFRIGLGFVFAIYILASKEKLIRIGKRMVYAFCQQEIAAHIIAIFQQANRIFSKFVGGQLTEACILGSLCTIGMYLLGFPYALMIGAVIGSTSLIPVLGAYIGVIPSAFILLMEKPSMAFWFIVFIIILQQFEGNVIYPRVVGGAIGLDGLWVLLAITLGGSLGGLFGMLVAVPTMALLYTLMGQLVTWLLRRKKIKID